MSYQIKTICLNDQLYPASLKQISHPPQKIYYLGTWPDQDYFHLAVVGSRLADAYGEAALKKILANRILEKTVIVSGLAKGIDAMAHQIALKTIAVIGTGLDKESFYPAENWFILEQILLKGGLIISEYPPGTSAQAKNFPARNRIIAGLSKAVLVVQAKKRSGALITARLALEDGKDVLAVPGSILNELSETCNSLISQGAIIISSSEDLEDCLTQNP